MGADKIIDHTVENFTKDEQDYYVVLGASARTLAGIE